MTACIAKTATGVQCLQKNVIIFVFIRLPSSVFFCVCHNPSDNLEFKMTRVEDTKLTLPVIPFYLGVNSFLFWYYKHTRKICLVSFPVRTIIPWFILVSIWELCFLNVQLLHYDECCVHINAVLPLSFMHKISNVCKGPDYSIGINSCTFKRFNFCHGLLSKSLN